MKNYDDYNDIIGHARLISNIYAPMPISRRAAQFSPFKALTGFDDALVEKARHTEKK
jgi:hypothetical protein